MEKVDHFFNETGITGKILCGVRDGVLAMLPPISGFLALVLRKVPCVVSTHCFVHQEALVS